jgi:hypothetical protein
MSQDRTKELSNQSLLIRLLPFHEPNPGAKGAIKDIK